MNLHIGKALGKATVSVLALMFFYWLGSVSAVLIGRLLRGGVNWGIGVFLLSGWFFLIAFTEHFLLQLITKYRIAIGFLCYILFVVVSFSVLGNNFTGSSWAHPFRFLFLLGCGLVILAFPIRSSLTIGSSRRTKAVNG